MERNSAVQHHQRGLQKQMFDQDKRLRNSSCTTCFLGLHAAATGEQFPYSNHGRGHTESVRKLPPQPRLGRTRAMLLLCFVCAEMRPWAMRRATWHVCACVQPTGSSYLCTLARQAGRRAPSPSVYDLTRTMDMGLLPPAMAPPPLATPPLPLVGHTHP